MNAIFANGSIRLEQDERGLLYECLLHAWTKKVLSRQLVCRDFVQPPGLPYDEWLNHLTARFGGNRSIAEDYLRACLDLDKLQYPTLAELTDVLERHQENLTGLNMIILRVTATGWSIYRTDEETVVRPPAGPARSSHALFGRLSNCGHLAADLMAGCR
jgi:hypothetical protein